MNTYPVTNIFIFFIILGQSFISPLAGTCCGGYWPDGLFGCCWYPPGICQPECCDSGFFDACAASQAGFTSFAPVLDLEVAFGETVGCDDDYATVATQIYTTFGPSPDISFLTTFKAHVLNHHGSFKFAANIGLGFRTYDWQASGTKGAHLFFDVREGKKHNFHGLGLSFEYLTRFYNLRLNGYFPVGRDNKKVDRGVFNFPGGFTARCIEKQVALKGVDFDVEVPFIITCNWIYSMSAGVYYFRNGGCANTSTGGMGTARLTWNGWLWLEGRYTYDREFGSRGQGVLAVNIPLCTPFWRKQECEGYTRTFVRRFDILPLDECCCWTTNFSNTNCTCH